MAGAVLLLNLMVHIGNKVKAVLKEKGLSISEFARRINTSRENIYGIFKRPTLDTGQLLKINEVLEHDFFQYFSSKVAVGSLNEDSGLYKSSLSKTKLIQIIKSMQQELDAAKSNLELTKKEIEYLKKINHLLEDKRTRV